MGRGQNGRVGRQPEANIFLPVPRGAGLQIRLSVRPSVRPRFPKTPPGGAPIRAKIGGDVQRGRGMKAVKTLYEKVAPVLRKMKIKIGSTLE